MCPTDGGRSGQGDTVLPDVTGYTNMIAPNTNTIHDNDINNASTPYSSKVDPHVLANITLCLETFLTNITLELPQASV